MKRQCGLELKQMACLRIGLACRPHSKRTLFIFFKRPLYSAVVFTAGAEDMRESPAGNTDFTCFEFCGLLNCNITAPLEAGYLVAK